ncbi:hypothetical protein U9M48_033221 [Paspalum notatum var. saurae]|uniref:Uncharacterized protein n=1 Tax=Paspalum notatum var. saurae TaxID=547442 RepID=A0AAQ3X5B5_PASNO
MSLTTSSRVLHAEACVPRRPRKESPCLPTKSTTIWAWAAAIGGPSNMAAASASLRSPDN